MFYINIENNSSIIKKYKRLDIEYVGLNEINYGTNVDNLNFKIKINIYKFDKKTKKKLDRIMNIIQEKNVVVNNLDIGIKEYLNQKNINIINSDRMFKIMLISIIQKIVSLSDLKKEYLRIGIIIDEINQDFLYNLKYLCLEYKELVIITANENLLEKIKDELYNNYGVILNINNKSLFLKSDIIVDFGTKINSEYIIGKSIYINLENSIKVLDGIEIKDFTINFDENNYLKYLNDLKEFDKKIIYQSLVFKNTKIENILKLINDDRVEVKDFIGINGIINKNEFKRYGNYIKKNKKIKMK